MSFSSLGYYGERSSSSVTGTSLANTPQLQFQALACAYQAAGTPIKPSWKVNLKSPLHRYAVNIEPTKDPYENPDVFLDGALL